MKKLFLFFAIVMMLCSCEMFQSEKSVEKLEISEDLEVHYTGDATEKEAKALGEFLEENKLTGEGKAYLTKEDDQYIVKLVYDEERYDKNRETYLISYSSLPSLISKEVFDGEETKLVLADEKFEDVDDVDPINKFKVNKVSTVYYKGRITKDDAKKLGDYLLEIEYFDKENTKDVILTPGKGEFVVRFIVDKKKYKENKEAALQDFKVYQHMISTYAFGGQKANLILTDTKFNDIEKVAELTSKEKARISDLIDQLKNPELYQTDSSNKNPLDSARIDYYDYYDSTSHK